MTLFAGFNIALFVLGIALWDSSPKKRFWVLAGACICLSIAYYYFDKI